MPVCKGNGTFACRYFILVKKEEEMEFLNLLEEGKEYKEMFYNLYQSAFPEQEKKTFSLMEKLSGEGKMEMLVITEGSEFLGLAINMAANRMALLDYFAITPQKRSGGYGGKALRKLLERYKGITYIFEIEMEDENASNAEERKRRKKFYLKNGLKPTGIYANVYQTDFELLTPDGELSYDAYIKFLEQILGTDAVQALNPHLLLQRQV